VRNVPEKQVINMYSTKRPASVENEPVIFSVTESTAPVNTAHMARSLPAYGGGGGSYMGTCLHICMCRGNREKGKGRN
jgi:hypothetical protein